MDNNSLLISEVDDSNIKLSYLPLDFRHLIKFYIHMQYMQQNIERLNFSFSEQVTKMWAIVLIVLKVTSNMDFVGSYFGTNEPLTS